MKFRSSVGYKNFHQSAIKTASAAPTFRVENYAKFQIFSLLRFQDSLTNYAIKNALWQSPIKRKSVTKSGGIGGQFIFPNPRIISWRNLFSKDTYLWNSCNSKGNTLVCNISIYFWCNLHKKIPRPYLPKYLHTGEVSDDIGYELDMSDVLFVIFCGIFCNYVCINFLEISNDSVNDWNI